MLALLLFGRGMDFLSTWLATPNLVLEGNPLAKKLGWKLGGLVNVVLCFAFAFWPLTAIIIITAGLLVAAHNFHSAWLMRSMGEEAYRQWFLEQISRARLPLFFLCLLGETALTGLVGAALLRFSADGVRALCHRLGHPGLCRHCPVLHRAFIMALASSNGVNLKAVQAVYHPTQTEFLKLAGQGNLIPVTRRILADLETPLSAYRKIRGQGESFLFESVEGGEHIGRYSFVGCNPRAVIRQQGRRVDVIENGKITGQFTVQASPGVDGAKTVRDGLEVVEQIMRRFKAVALPGLPRLRAGRLVSSTKLSIPASEKE